MREMMRRAFRVKWWAREVGVEFGCGEGREGVEQDAEQV